MNAAPKPISRLTLIVLSATVFVSVMNASMSSIVLPLMELDFLAEPDELSWVVTAYLIPFACGTVIFGRLADIHGSRRLHLLGLAIFAAASMGVATSPNLAMVILMRTMQGFGGAAIPALSMAAIMRSTSSETRGPAMGYTIVAVGLGFGFGPIIGGVLADFGGWQAPFVFTGVAGGILLGLAAKFLPGFEGDSKQKFDTPGAVLLALAVTANVIALNRLPRQVDDSLGVTALAFSIPLWIALLFWTRRADSPFLPPKVVGNGKFMRMSVVGFAAQGSHFAVIVVLPLLFSQYHDLSTFEIGMRLLPGAIALGIFGMAGGLLVHRMGERVLLIGGTWVLFAGVLTLHLAGVDWSSWNVALLYVAIASGYGMINAGVIKAATDQLPEESAGIGTGVFNLSFFLGGAVTVAILGALLRARSTATEAINPLFQGTALTYSDALIVVVVLAFAAFLLALLQPPPKVVFEPDDRQVYRLRPTGTTNWPVKPRSKPNSDVPRR